MAAPTGWHDDGINTLMAPNGIPVTDGFRKWILTHSWTQRMFHCAQLRDVAHCRSPPWPGQWHSLGVSYNDARMDLKRRTSLRSGPGKSCLQWNRHWLREQQHQHCATLTGLYGNYNARITTQSRWRHPGNCSSKYSLPTQIKEYRCLHLFFLLLSRYHLNSL